jgi:hypothetical protein
MRCDIASLRSECGVPSPRANQFAAAFAYERLKNNSLEFLSDSLSTNVYHVPWQQWRDQNRVPVNTFFEEGRKARPRAAVQKWT